MHPGSVDEAALGCASSCDEELPVDLKQDAHLVTDSRHTKATLTVLHALHQQINDASALGRSIFQWSDILNCCNNLSDLIRKIDDVAAWTDLLDMLSEHLHLHGHHTLELQTLFISLRVLELGYTGSKLTISLMRLSIAQLLLQIGHTADAGVQLNKARDDLTSSSTNLSVQADYSNTLALYYIALGSFEQR